MMASLSENRFCKITLCKKQKNEIITSQNSELLQKVYVLAINSFHALAEQLISEKAQKLTTGGKIWGVCLKENIRGENLGIFRISMLHYFFA